jgi:class 3 adenylate cyclase
MSAQELVAEINTCFGAFDNIIVGYGLEKIKTIGDAYMAAGGLPVPDSAAIKNTVLAALDMQEFICRRKEENTKEGKTAFEMRIGIETGPIVAGVVGTKKFQYDIWGDTVNTASRLETLGEIGKVNISRRTYEAIKDDEAFTFERRGNVPVKGKGEMEMWYVVKR